jgi:hypothetical protein
VRADVRDNGYAFVVARPRRPEQRYVVWTGGDGTPHVQPVVLTPFPPRCRSGLIRAPRVTPPTFPLILGTAILPARPGP